LLCWQELPLVVLAPRQKTISGLEIAEKPCISREWLTVPINGYVGGGLEVTV
jgi:hypothetical protein